MIKKAGKKKKSKSDDAYGEPSALAKKLQEFAAVRDRRPVTLSLNKDIYLKAQQQFGKRKVSAIIEAALEDLLKVSGEDRNEEGDKKEDLEEEKKGD